MPVIGLTSVTAAFIMGVMILLSAVGLAVLGFVLNGGRDNSKINAFAGLLFGVVAGGMASYFFAVTAADEAGKEAGSKAADQVQESDSRQDSNDRSR